jgi:hypothetical protein
MVMMDLQQNIALQPEALMLLDGVIYRTSIYFLIWFKHVLNY